MLPGPMWSISKVLGGLTLVLVLLGCETEKVQQTRSGIQQNLFLQSLALVENAGSLLQTPDPKPAAIEQAMKDMDQGLSQAYQVDEAFLKQLDIRLPKQFSESFIAGVENYRIGVEAADRNKQLVGLNQLGHWANFWAEEKSDILLKMTRITGLPLEKSEAYRAIEQQFNINQTTTEVTY